MSAFDRIIGYDSVKKELFQIIDMIKNPEVYEKMGANFVHGVLICGQPGIGKTMLAEALLEESGVLTFTVRKKRDKRSTLIEINEVFCEAAGEKTAIVFIDDIDKFSESADEDVDDELFVAIQSAIDEVKNHKVLVIATANNPKKLPFSLTRSGRFDRRIALDPPTEEEARLIIEHYLKQKCVSEDLNYEDVAKMISYTSCADLETVINESAVYAANMRKDRIDIDDIAKAYLRKSYGAPDDALATEKDPPEVIGIHEAGHAAVAELLAPGSVGFVSIRSGDDRTGFTHLCKEFTRRPDNVLIALAGKAAVELFYEGRCGSGCQSDLDRALTLLKGGVDESGTCGVGLLDLSAYGKTQASEAYLSARESAVKGELERYLFIVRDILIKNREFVMSLSKKLLEKQLLLYSDIKKLRESVKLTDIGTYY